MKPSTTPDYEKAQRVIRAALVEASKTCGFTDQIVEFAVILSAVQSRIVAELVSSAVLMRPGGIEAVASHISGTLAEFLREDLGKRAEHERRKERH